jgi:hypothetical protein
MMFWKKNQTLPAETDEAKKERLGREIDECRVRTAALRKELSAVCKHTWRLDGRCAIWSELSDVLDNSLGHLPS